MAESIGIRDTQVITAIKGISPGGKLVDIGIDGLARNSLKTFDENNLLIKEVVKQLKINNKILNEVHDLTVNELDIK